MNNLAWGHSDWEGLPRRSGIPIRMMFWER